MSACATQDKRAFSDKLVFMVNYIADTAYARTQFYPGRIKKTHTLGNIRYHHMADSIIFVIYIFNWKAVK